MGKKMKLDFTGVESFQKLSEGAHACKIASAEVKQSQGGNDMIVVSFEAIKGDEKGSRVYENYPLVETALWKLKGMLQAIGMKAEGKVQLDLDKLIGKTLTVNVFHEEYEGQMRAKVDSVMKLTGAATTDDDDDEDEEEEQEETKPVKKAAKKAPINKPEPEDEDDEDDDWDEDEDEDEEEEEKPAKKPAAKATKKAAKAPAKKAAKKSEPEDDDDEDWDEDDDDWDEE